LGIKALALAQFQLLCLGKAQPALSPRLQKAQVELLFGSGRLFFQAVQQVLVEQRRSTLGVRALVVDVVDAAQQGVGCHLTFIQPNEWFDLPRQLGMAGRQHRSLARQIAGRPVQRVLEEHRRLVIHIVSCGYRSVLALASRRVHDVTLDQPAQTAGAAPTPATRHLRNALAMLLNHADHTEGRITLGCKALHLVLRKGRIVTVLDAEIDVQRVHGVAQLDQDIPESQTVFATRHGDQHPVIRREHAKLLNGTLHLLWYPLQEAVLAQG
jgi:hypothetical protein